MLTTVQPRSEWWAGRWCSAGERSSGAVIAGGSSTVWFTVSFTSQGGCCCAGQDKSTSDGPGCAKSLFQSIVLSRSPAAASKIYANDFNCPGSSEIDSFVLELGNQVMKSNNERVKPFKSMGIVEKFPAFSDEDIQNVCNNILMMMIIILLWLYVVTDIPFPCSYLFLEHSTP